MWGGLWGRGSYGLRPGTWRGPEYSLLSGVQAAVSRVDGGLTLWSKGAPEVLEQEQVKCGSHLGEDLVQALVRGLPPALGGSLLGAVGGWPWVEMA